MLDVVSVVMIALLVVAVIGMARTGWGIWHRNEELEAGGSFGDQLLGSPKDEQAPRPRK